MPYSLPEYNVNRISIGPCVIYLGEYGTSGNTPTVDVGAVEAGATLSTTRDKEEVFQGFPKTLIAQFATSESASLKLTSIEWNFNNLLYAIGAGLTSGTSDTEIFDFGGQLTFQDVAIKLMHQTPYGHTLYAYIWKAQGDGAISLGFTDTHHTFEYTFNAIIPFDACTKQVLDWNGNELPVGKQLFKLVLEKAADPCA